jgi:hypothetical protein
VNEKKVYTVMGNNSTYINKINNCLSPQTIEHKIFHDIWDWKSRSLLRTGTKCGRVKQVNGIPTLPLLIIGCKQTMKNLYRCASTINLYRCASTINLYRCASTINLCFTLGLTVT